MKNPEAGTWGIDFAWIVENRDKIEANIGL
jgi:hypothetical protein